METVSGTQCSSTGENPIFHDCLRWARYHTIKFLDASGVDEEDPECYFSDDLSQLIFGKENLGETVVNTNQMVCYKSGNSLLLC